MKNFTRFLALTLAILFAVGTISISANTFADTADSAYAEAIDAVSSLGIIDGASSVNFQPTLKIARWRFVVYAAKALTGVTDDATWMGGTNTTTFTDVTGKTAPAAVSYAVSLDLIKGRSETVFDPYATITLAEATAIMVRALGYDYDVHYSTDFADAWKWAYLAKAMELGIVDGLAADALDPDHPVTKDEAALIIYNTLFINRKNGSTIADKVWGGVELTSEKVTQLVITSAKPAGEATSLVTALEVHTTGYVKLNGFIDGKVDDSYTLYMKSDEFKAYTGFSAKDLVDKKYIGASVDVTFEGDEIIDMKVNAPQVKAALATAVSFDGTTVTVDGTSFETAGADLYASFVQNKYEAGYPVYREEGVPKMSKRGEQYYGVDGEPVVDEVGNKFFLDVDDNIVAEWVHDVNSVAYKGVIVSGQYGKFASSAEIDTSAPGANQANVDGNYRYATDADLAKVAYIYEEYKPSLIANETDLTGIKDVMKIGQSTIIAFDDDGDGENDRIFVQGNEYTEVIGRVSSTVNGNAVQKLVWDDQNAKVAWAELVTLTGDKLNRTINDGATAYTSFKALKAADEADFFVAMVPANANAAIEIIEWIPYNYGQIVNLDTVYNPQIGYENNAAAIGIKDKTTGVTNNYFVDVAPSSLKPNYAQATWKYRYNNVLVAVAEDVEYVAAPGINNKTLADKSVLVSQWVEFVHRNVTVATAADNNGKITKSETKDLILYIAKDTEQKLTNMIFVSTDISTGSFDPYAANFTVLNPVKGEITTVEKVNLVDTIFNKFSLNWLYKLRSNLSIVSGDINYVATPSSSAQNADFAGLDQLWADETLGAARANLLYLSFTKDHVGDFYTVDVDAVLDWTETNIAKAITEYTLSDDVYYIRNTTADHAQNPYYFKAGTGYSDADLLNIFSKANNANQSLEWTTDFGGHYAAGKEKKYTFEDESAYFVDAYEQISALDEYTTSDGTTKLIGGYVFFGNIVYSVSKACQVQRAADQKFLQFTQDILNSVLVGGKLPSTLKKTSKTFTVYESVPSDNKIYTIDSNNMLWQYTAAVDNGQAGDDFAITTDATLTQLNNKKALTAAQKAGYAPVVAQNGHMATKTFVSVGVMGADTPANIDTVIGTQQLYKGATLTAAEYDANTDKVSADVVYASAWSNDPNDLHGLPVTATEVMYDPNTNKPGDEQYRYTYTPGTDAGNGNISFVKSNGVNYDGKEFNALMYIDGATVGAISDATKFVVIEPQAITVNSAKTAYTQSNGFTFTTYNSTEIQKMKIAVYQYRTDADANGTVATYVILFGNVIPGDTATIVLTELANATISDLELNVPKKVSIGDDGKVSYTVTLKEGYPNLTVKVNGTKQNVDANGKFTFAIEKDKTYQISVVAAAVPQDKGTVNVVKDNNTSSVKYGTTEAKATQELDVGEYVFTVTPKAGFPNVSVKINNKIVDVDNNTFTLTVEKDQTYNVEVSCSAFTYVYLNTPFNSTLVSDGNGKYVWNWNSSENVARDIFTTEVLSGSVYETYIWDPSQNYPDHIYQGKGVYTIKAIPNAYGYGEYQLVAKVATTTAEITALFTDPAIGGTKLGTGAYFGSEINNTYLYFDFFVDTANAKISVANRTSMQQTDFRFVSFTEEKGYFVVDQSKFNDLTVVNKTDKTAYNFLPWNTGAESFSNDVWTNGMNKTGAELATLTGDAFFEGVTTTFMYTLASDGKIIVFVNTVDDATIYKAVK